MPTKTWKAAERRIAGFFGGTRRGADFRDKFNGGGKTDVVKDGWAIEIKHGKRPTYGLMTGAVAQAEANREKPDDIPVAVIHREGDRYQDSLVVMRLETFLAFFVNLEKSSDEQHKDICEQ